MDKLSTDLSAFQIDNLDFDFALESGSALDQDLLSRRGFAEIATSSLTKVSGSSGFVLSIEGPWGSGKSSTLAMIQELLEKDKSAGAPIIVHFNPWLIGEKEALLRQFLSSVAKAIKLSDHSKDGKKVAKELKAYSKIFDLVKLIPGAEPWTSIIKSVVEAAGDTTEAISEYKTPDIEAYKQRVQVALKSFNRPVIVFIDDIDRLFPDEVFEMIRIIKAVGGLPRIGYVVAWDAAYINDALKNLRVPQANSYLDKIVQVRMALPNLSQGARAKLFDSAVNKLDAKALHPYFEDQNKRLGYFYHSGLRDLLEQPRDVARVFNALRIMEPLLRGEIVFSDILGLAALSVKAPSVFDLLKRKPRLFVGWLSDDQLKIGDSEKLISNGIPERNLAYQAGGGEAAQKVVHFLFPDVARADDCHALGEGSYSDGVLAHPSRLAVALQMSITDSDVSISAVRKYLQHPKHRAHLVSELSADNCEEFVEMLGEIGKSLIGQEIDDIEELCLAVARLADEPLFISRTKATKGSFRGSIEDRALSTIKELVSNKEKNRISSIHEKIAKDSKALSCSAELLRRSYIKTETSYKNDILLDMSLKAKTVQAFADNVLHAAEANVLLEKNRVGPILWTLGHLKPEVCSKVFATLKSFDSSMDNFAIHFLSSTWDSSKGQAFGLPNKESLAEAYCSLEILKKHALSRLSDTALEFPTRAAWQSVVEGKRFYGVDGTEAFNY